MIRLREKGTGAEAEWDRHKWSGDARFIKRLKTLDNIFRLSGYAHDTYASIQRRMAEMLPRAGIEVVRQTKPKEVVHEEGRIY